MRVLASADIHGRWEVYEWLITKAEEFDVDAIILAGDLLGCPDGFDTPEEAQRHEARGLVDLLAGAGVPVLYIMGNDDLIELNSEVDRVESIHARHIKCGRFNFVGYQYSLPFMGGTFEKTDDDIRDDCALLAASFDDRTVFVSHSPAYGILDPGIADAPIGSRSLREILDEHPFRVHIHGHSHGGFGRRDRHFNVAAAGRTRAIMIDLETLQHQSFGVVA